MDNIPQQVCPVCKQAMSGEPLSVSDGHVKIKYTCGRSNCPKNRYPVIKTVKSN